jgi:hypothetical protein
MHVRLGRLAPLASSAVVALFLLAGLVGLAQGSAVPNAQIAGASGLGSVPAVTGRGTCGQALISLGAAGNFRVLAGSTITNTGATTIHGNIGVSPGSAVTGFPPGTVSGKIDKADTAAAHGEAAMQTAYNAAQGRSNCPISVAGNLGGKTLGPGLYKSTSSLSISKGDLTLSAHGHSSAVWVFQTVTKFTTTSGRKVILTGGAQASHIFWAIGSSATLGTTSVMYGTILAHKSISLATGAVLHGRAFAHVGAVTFAGNTVKNGPVQGPVAPTAATPLMVAARPAR